MARNITSADIEAAGGDTVARGSAEQAASRLTTLTAAGPRNPTSQALPYLMRNTAAIMARVRAGTGNGRIALLGDSTSFGTGATGRTQDYAHRLAAILTAAGVPSETDSLWGFHGFNATTLAAYDNRWTAGSFSSSTVSIAGNMFSDTAGTTAMTFTPEKSVGVFDVWYPADPQFGTFAVQVDSGPVQNVAQSARNGVYTLSGGVWTQTTAPTNVSSNFGYARFVLDTVAAHTLKIARVSGNIKISGMHGYRNDIRQIAIHNWGRPGETSVGYASGTSYWNFRGNPGPQAAIAPDLTLIDLGINDVNQAVTPANYYANMQLLITAAKVAVKDVALMVPVPSNYTGNLTQANQLAMRAQIELLASANGIPIIGDMPVRWGEYVSGNALGYYGAAPDGVHPGDVGYADKAQALARVLLTC